MRTPYQCYGVRLSASSQNLILRIPPYFPRTYHVACSRYNRIILPQGAQRESAKAQCNCVRNSYAVSVGQSAILLTRMKEPVMRGAIPEGLSTGKARKDSWATNPSSKRCYSFFYNVWKGRWNLNASHRHTSHLTTIFGNFQDFFQKIC